MSTQTRWRHLRTGETIDEHKPTETAVVLEKVTVDDAGRSKVQYRVYQAVDGSSPAPTPTEIAVHSKTGAALFGLEIGPDIDPKAAEEYAYGGWLPLFLIAYKDRPGPPMAVYLGDDWTSAPEDWTMPPKAGWVPTGVSATDCLKELEARAGLKVFHEQPPDNWPLPADIRKAYTATARDCIRRMAAKVQADATYGPPDGSPDDGPERATWTERTNNSRTELRQTLQTALNSIAVEWQVEPPSE